MHQATSPKRTQRRKTCLGARSRAIVALTATVVWGQVDSALASDFVDTRLNVTLTNENVLAAPGNEPAGAGLAV